MVSYLEKARLIAESIEAAEPTRCEACTCDAYIVKLQGKCASCGGKLCGICEDCMALSHLWRRENGVMPEAEVPLDGLLERLQRGSEWLAAKHDQLYEVDVAYDKEFDDLLNMWDELESALRVVHNYEHCIFGEDQRCPDDTVVKCAACVLE
jgi:hypothetical protein